MPNPNTENDRTLQTLTRSLTQSPGRFSLILVRCNYTNLRDRIVAQVCEQCSIEIQQLTLSSSAKTLYTTIVNEFGEQPTDAVMVLGLESVMALDDLLGATNKVRDQFRSFPFPVVLWVTDRVLRQLMRVAPDFKSWAGPPLEFKLPYQELMGLLAQQAEQIFTEEPNFTVEGDELEAIEQDLSSCGQELAPELKASLALMKGLIQYRDNQLDAALDYYQQSLAFFEPSPKASKNQNPQNHNVGDVGDVGEKHLGDNSSAKPELNNPNASPSSDSFKPPPDNPPPNPLPGGGVRVQGEGVRVQGEGERVQRGGERVQQGIVLLQLGLTYYRKGEQHWLDSRNYLQQCLDKFEEAQRQDLVAKHINQLCQVQQGLENWESLENRAQQALELHQNHGNPGRLVEDYSFLAEVALKKEQWQEAKQWAQQALAILENNRNVREGSPEKDSLLPVSPSPCPRVYFQLAKSEQGLGEITKAIRNLEQARDQTQPQHQLSLYLEILQELRSLYFDQGQYREAFYLKLEQREVESRYGLRAFVGAGRLQPPVLKREEGSQVTVAEQVEDIVAASGRQQDVERLIERVNRADCKLTVIHGQSGVGKSSILQAGLVPALEVSYFEGREAIPVFVDVYTDWLGELGKGLSIDNESRRDINRPPIPPILGGTGLTPPNIDTAGEFNILEYSSPPARNSRGVQTPSPPVANSKGAQTQSPPELGDLGGSQQSSDITKYFASGIKGLEGQNLQTILEQLRQNGQRHRLTVLIFDQFEEFFFVYKDQASRRPFYEFLRHCLEIPYVKIILSLREDYLHYLLELTRTNNFEGFDDNYKHLLYYLGNFSPADAKSVIQNLTQRSQFYLEPDLVEELVKELAGEVGEIRPIELQIVGAQLQTDNITTLDQYRVTGTKDELVKQFLADVVKDCGVGNEQIANLVLYLLTDENNTRPLKTKNELARDLAADSDKLELVLEILVGSGLVFRVPEFPANRYQLIHDYLVYFIRQQQGAELRAELEKTKREQQRTQEQLNQFLKRRLREAYAAGAVLTILTASAIGLWQHARYQVTQRTIAELKALNSASQALFLSNDQLGGLVNAVKAGRQLQQTTNVPKDIHNEIVTDLRQALYKMRESNRLQGHNSWVSRVSFSPNGEMIASASADKTVKLWNRQGKTIRTLKGHNDWVYGVSFSPNGEMIASASADKTVKLWNREGTLLKTFKGHSGSVRDVSFSQDGEIIASASADKTIKLWNLQGEEIRTITGHKAEVTSVSFSSDGEIIASASTDKTIKLWNLQGEEIKTLRGHNDWVYSVNFSPDGQTLVSGSADGTIRTWGKDGQLLKTISGHSTEISSVAFSPDGQSIVSTSANGTVKLWPLDSKLPIVLHGFGAEVISVSFSPDSQTLASADTDQIIKLWRYGSNAKTQIQTIEDSSSDSNKLISPSNIKSVSFSRNGKIIATGGNDGNITLWNLEGEKITTFKGHSGFGFINSVSFSPDGKTIATSGFDTTIKLWNLQGEEITTFKGHSGFINSVSFSPDGKTIATGDDKIVKLWNLQGEEITTFKGHSGFINSVSFSPDGKTIATGDDKIVKLWNLEEKEITTLRGHSNFVNSVIFSPDGKTIATGDDKIVKLWNLEGEEIGTFQGHTTEVLSLSFSQDGEKLASISSDGIVNLWDLDLYNFDLDGLLEHACSWLHDYLKTNSDITEHNFCAKTPIPDLLEPTPQHSSSTGMQEPDLIETPSQLTSPTPPFTSNRKPFLEESPAVVNTNTFTVESFNIVGNTAFSDEEIAKVVSPFTARPITFKELEQTTHQVAQLYSDKGYTTSGAKINAPSLTDPVITIQVIEGGVEKIEIQGVNTLRKSYIHDRIALATQAPLNTHYLQKMLQLLQEEPFLDSVSAELSSGSGLASSVLLVKLKEAPLLDIDVGLKDSDY